ncbi:5-formyltetrahydrofolate cyclo-ligase [Methylopila musalis]|uniref:5-formyltetrahydrofolate cyclo-ligase n=1 Tax=Methylopila musalis TaxID=1134781 RepID=A0ABW3Z7D9_9HYPH
MTQPTVPDTEAAAAKAALRSYVLARRAALAPDVRAAAAEAIAREGEGLVARLRPASVSVFFPVRGEIDAGPLMARLAARGVPLALPVIVEKDAPLAFRAWAPGEPLETKRFGLQEPPASAPEIAPELLFVPLAAFDDRGYRLGYGGGFYDRTLEKLRARGRAIAVGLAFAAQRTERVPIDRYDQRLDGVLTEQGLLTIGDAI